MIFDENDNLPDRRVKELQTMIAEREARLTQLSGQITHARHEINNALTGIIGHSQLLLREELNVKSRNRVESIQQLSNRIGELVANINDE